MTDDEIKSSIRSFLSRSFNGQLLADGDDIFALGFANSLFAMQLVAFVEGQFNVEIESDDLELDNFRSVQAIAGLVDRKLATPAQ